MGDVGWVEGTGPGGAWECRTCYLLSSMLTKVEALKLANVIEKPIAEPEASPKETSGGSSGITGCSNSQFGAGDRFGLLMRMGFY